MLLFSGAYVFVCAYLRWNEHASHSFVSNIGDTDDSLTLELLQPSMLEKHCNWVFCTVFRIISNILKKLISTFMNVFALISSLH